MRSEVGQKGGSASGRSFALYLRTGLRLAPEGAGGRVAIKFNQNHDPADGRFTFGDGGSQFRSGGGSFGGGGATGTFGPGPSRSSPKHAKNHTIHVVRKGDSLNKIAALRNGLTARELAALNRVDKSNALRVDGLLMLPTQRFLDARRAARTPDPSWRRVSKNGYDFRVDRIGRTRSADGVLTLNVDQRRSGTAQINAGKPDRLADDHGGHYIARMFNGPTDSVNHFAQNKGFNSSAYRKLENMWARKMQSGMKVAVHIVPHYEGGSMRPSQIFVRYTINGESLKKKFPNTAEAKSYG